MRKKTLLLLLSVAALTFKSYAGTKDSSVVITSAITKIEFEWSQKRSQVEVKQSDELTYLTTAYDVTIPVAEFYNDHLSIDAVEFKLNGRLQEGFKPEYSYYTQNNIFYSDAHVCFFPIYLKEKGNKASVYFEKTVNDPRYFTSLFLTEPYKILERKVIIKVPRWMKVDFKDLNFNGLAINKSVSYDKGDDGDIITYTARNLPAEVKENDAPGPTYTYPHLLVLCKESSAKGQKLTYFNTLADQYGWYRELVKTVVNNNSVLKAKAEEISKSATDDLQRIKSVFYWVQNNIRYIAFEDGIAGFRPEKADEVLRKNYGDCKGMAHLCKSLLKELGFDARLCWIGTNHIAYNYDTPSMAVDNHMICAVIYKGKTYFLDATETYLPFGEYAERIQGRQVLIEDGEKYILSNIPSTTVNQNLEYEKRTLTIKGDALSGSGLHLLKGEEKEYLLTRIYGTRKSEVTTSLSKYLSHNLDNKVEKVTTSNLEDLDEDLKINYQIQQKTGLSSFGKDYYVEMDLRKDFGSFTIDTLERSQDYWFDYKYNVERETELTVPENYMVSGLPENLTISKKDYDFSISYTALADKVIYKKSIRIKNPRISKQNFSVWNNDIKKLNDAYNETLILKPKQ